MRKFMNQKLSTAWNTWHAWFEEIMRQKLMVSGVLCRILHRKLSQAWEQWQQVCEKLRDETENASRALRIWQHYRIAVAWRSWGVYLETSAVARGCQFWVLAKWRQGLMNLSNYAFHRIHLRELEKAKMALIEEKLQLAEQDYLSPRSSPLRRRATLYWRDRELLIALRSLRHIVANSPRAESRHRSQSAFQSTPRGYSRSQSEHSRVHYL